MATVYNFDRVEYSSTTTGTGNLTITPAAGCIEPSSDSYFPYSIVNTSNTAQWENGIGRRNGTTFYRTQVLNSSDGDSLVSFAAGVKTLVCAPTGVTSALATPPDATAGIRPQADPAGAVLGHSAVAGANASAVGCQAYAGDHSTSIGAATVASGYAVAAGKNALASTNSVAIGNNTIAEYEGIAIGYGALAQRNAGASSGTSGIVIGNNSHISNYASYGPGVILGSNSLVWENSVTIGNGVQANWWQTVSLGCIQDTGSNIQTQRTVTFLQGETTNATLTSLGVVCDSYNGSTTGAIGGMLYQVDVVGMDASNNLACIRIVGAMRYGGIVGTPVTTSVGKSSALSAATATATYNSGGLSINVQGVSGITIRWGVTVTTTWMAPRF